MTQADDVLAAGIAFRQSSLAVVRCFNEQRVPTLDEAAWASASILHYTTVLGVDFPAPEEVELAHYDDIPGDAAEHQ